MSFCDRDREVVWGGLGSGIKSQLRGPVTVILCCRNGGCHLTQAIGGEDKITGVWGIVLFLTLGAV